MNNIDMFVNALKELNSKLSDLGIELAEVTERKNVLERDKEFYQNQIGLAMDSIDEELGRNPDDYIDNIETDSYVVKCHKKKQVVIVEDDALLGDEFLKVKYEPNKTAIKKALDNGEEVQGAKLSEEEYKLKIEFK